MDVGDCADNFLTFGEKHGTKLSESASVSVFSRMKVMQRRTRETDKDTTLPRTKTTRYITAHILYVGYVRGRVCRSQAHTAVDRLRELGFERGDMSIFVRGGGWVHAPGRRPPDATDRVVQGGRHGTDFEGDLPI